MRQVGSVRQSDGTRPNQVLQFALRMQFRQMSAQRRRRPKAAFPIPKSRAEFHFEIK